MLVEIKKKYKTKKLSFNDLVDIYYNHKPTYIHMPKCVQFNGEEFIFEIRKQREGYHGKESKILLETALKRKGFSKADKILKVVIEEEHNITIEELLKLLEENNIPLSTKICIVDEWGISPLNYIEYENDEIILGS